MIQFAEHFSFNFGDCGLGITARRLWEHTNLHQINPFKPITATSTLNPQDYVDIIDVSLPIAILTDLTLSDLLQGNYGRLSKAHVEQLLDHVDHTDVRQWLVSVSQHLQHFSKQRAVRNLPEPFLPADSTSPLGVQGLHCALATWIKSHRNERATVKQWSNRIKKLTQKGLRSDEMEFSNLREILGKIFDAAEQDSSRTFRCGDQFGSLSYEHLHFSILPMIYTTNDDHLSFSKVPANATIRRIKPKLKRGLVTHPLWRDRVLGYWIDEVIWDDLLGHQRRWMAFTHRGQPIISNDSPSGLCTTHEEARTLADNHAKHVFPKITAKGRWSEYRLTGGEQYREWLVTLPYYPQSYFSSHFKHRNVLLHVRSDIREDANGERVLMLQEVQSDWAQQARRSLSAGDDSLEEIPTPPWLQEWPLLALKLMLLHAAQRGIVALAWTRGSDQVERYEGLGEAGLLELYDRTLPNGLTRILRPYGRKCESIDIFQPVNFYIEPADIGYEVWDEDRNILGKAATWEEAQKLFPDGAHEILKSMHGISLDEALRQQLLRDGFYAWGAGIQ